MSGDDFKPEVEFDINPGDVVALTGGDYRLPGPNGSVYILHAATGSLTYHGAPAEGGDLPKILRGDPS